MSEANDKATTKASVEIPKICKAGVVVNEGENFRVEVQDVAVPQPGPDEVLIRLNCTGICASDIHYMKGDLGRGTMSQWGVRSPGHEGAGVIVQVGSNVTNWSIGDRAGIKPVHNVCGVCDACWSGKDANCRSGVMAGVKVPGSYQQYVTSPASYTQPIPDGVDDYTAGPIMCAGGTIYSSIKQSGLQAGDFACFPGGGGGVGLQGVQIAAVMGMRPIVIDTGDERRKVCQDKGAIAFVDFKETPNVAQEVVRLCDGIGAHGVFVTAPAAYKYAIACVGTRTSAAVMCIGLPPAGSTIIGDEPSKFVSLNLTVKGTRVSSRHETAKVLQLAACGMIQSVHTEIYPIARLPEAVEKIRNGNTAGRSVVDFNL